MKLDTTAVEQLIKVINTANAIGIDMLIVDGESTRGRSESGTVMIIEPNAIDVTGFEAMGISRVNVLKQRLSLITTDTIPIVEVDLKERDNGDKTALRLIIRNKKTMVEFKCSDPKRIDTKRGLKAPVVYSFNITEDTLNLLSKSKAAMGINNISFTLEDGAVIFKINDVEGDSLQHIVTTKVTCEDGEDKFFFTYNDKSILALLKLALKNNGEVQINLSKKGTLNLLINNLNVYIIPELK